jgi:hypothetical protein
MISRTGPGPKCTNTLSREADSGISIDARVRVRTATRISASVEFSASMVRRLLSQLTAGGCGGVCSAVGGAAGGASAVTGAIDAGGMVAGVSGFPAETAALSLWAEFLLGAEVACPCTRDKATALVQPSADRNLPIRRSDLLSKPLPGTCATAIPLSLDPDPEIPSLWNHLE